MSATALTFSASQISMPFGAQYTSANINAKSTVNTPPGILRGFGLTNGGAGIITITADPTSSDHSAVYETASGYSLTIRKTGGDFTTPNLITSFANKTVAIAIHAVYVAGPSTPTSAVLKIYDMTTGAPADEFTTATERSELIVLGTVLVPAAGVIPIANISYDFRNNAWENIAPGALRTEQVVSNYKFNRALTGSIAKYAATNWELASITGGTSIIVAGAGSGSSNAYQFTLTTATAKTGILLSQKIGIPAFGAAHLKCRIGIRCLQVAPTGSLNFNATWRNMDGDAGSALTKTIDISAVDLAVRTVDFTLAVNNTNIETVLLDYIHLDLNTADYSAAAPGPAFIIDSVQCWLEQENVLNSQNSSDKEGTALNTTLLKFEGDGDSYNDANAAALMSYASGTRFISIERQDQDATGDQIILAPKGQIQIGDNNLAAEAKAILPRIITKYASTAGIDYTLIWESKVNSGTKCGARLYVNSNVSGATDNIGDIIFTINAGWSGTAWVKDLAGTTSRGYVLSTSLSMLEMRTRYAANDANWTVWDEISIKFSADINALNVFKGGLSITPTADPGGSSRLQTSSVAIGTEARTLQWIQTPGDGSSGTIRHYLTSTGILEITYNALWVTASNLWTRDTAAKNSTKIQFDDIQNKLFFKSSATNDTPWNDVSWNTTRGITLDQSTSTVTNIDGIYKITNATTSAGGSNPASTVALTNELRAKNICKGWGNVSTTGGIGTVVVNDGINIVAPGVSDTRVTGGKLRIKMASAMANTDYCITANMIGTAEYVNITVISTTEFDLQVITGATGTAVNLATSNRTLMFQFYGRQ